MMLVIRFAIRILPRRLGSRSNPEAAHFYCLYLVWGATEGLFATRTFSMSLQGGHTCAVSVWDSLPPGAAQPSARQPMHRILIIATIVGLAAGPARAGFDEAKAAYKRGDHITAMRELRPLAEQGNTEAQTIVGAMHLTGQGVPQDYNKAASWLKRAARTGQPRAQFALGMLYTEGWGVPRDDVQAHKWLNLAASRLPPGNDLKNAVKDRDRIAKKLTPERLAEAQRLASNWRPVLDVSGLKLIATYGSGFIVSPAGHVLTHADVVDRCRAITASVDPKGRSNPQFDKRPLKLVAIDAGYDLAVLESAAPVASLARFRSEPSVRTGETVVVAGLPPFSDLNVTTGESSGTLDLGNNVNLIQITASVLPSNSGGPLLDASGNVVGVVAR